MKNSKLLFIVFSFSLLVIGIKASFTSSNNPTDFTSSNNPTEQVIEFLEDNSQAIETEIEDGIQKDLLPNQILENILNILEKNGSENSYISKMFKRIRKNVVGAIWSTGELIAYPFKKAGEKISDAARSTMNKVTGFANWFVNCCDSKWLMFLGAWWVLKNQFNWWFNNRFLKNKTKFWIAFGIVVTLATVVTEADKLYGAGYILCKLVGCYAATAAVV